MSPDDAAERLGYEFELDRFQRDAIETLAAGKSVLVAAPTGSGKTVVAEYAVEAALSAGGKAFYTAPIKALSNQKYHDLVQHYGSQHVGLLTGDNAINGDASVVVMTTEVLRNMVYASSPTLDGLLAVVLDEVHFLQDFYRGPVWEEVIIHLDQSVQLVCLSATVSNAPEVAEWIGTVRGPTDVVVEARRPVELENLYLVGDRAESDLHLLPTLVDGRANPRGDRFDADAARRVPGRHRRRWFTPRRAEVVALLAERDLLPAINFIFSRAACDDAATAGRESGLVLTTAIERERIGEIVAERTAGLSDEDLQVLELDRFRRTLEAGFAAHHAGMVPPFKEAVERCFVEGLIKVVFATETLALGINMPARTVVIERLTRFRGEGHEFLTPADFTQITGRAGRRGIDEHGYAVVLWSPFVRFRQIAELAASRTFELRSAFRPTYNMAANLVRTHPPEEAHRLLASCFAQFQADREVVGLERRRNERRERLDGLRRDATCERGSVTEYRALLDRGRRRGSPRGVIEQALARLRPGEVILLDDGRPAAVIAVSQRKRGATRVRVVAADGVVGNEGAPSFDEPPWPVATVDLPVPFTPGARRFQQEVAASVRALDLSGDSAQGVDDADAVVSHPVHGCSDRDVHVRASKRLDRLEREVAELERKRDHRSETLVRQFDRVLQLLEGWGYLDGWALSDRGRCLVDIFHESDLLVAEALVDGLFDGLEPPELAGLVSCLTYEHRSSAPAPEPWFPSRDLARRADRLLELARRLNADEEAARLPLTRLPEPSFLDFAYAWAAGDELIDVLEEDDALSGGDFVRNIKQLVDLLRQIGDVAPHHQTARNARRAADRLLRGVVAASTQIPDEDVSGDPAG